MTTLQLRDGRSIDLKKKSVVRQDEDEEVQATEPLPSMQPKARVGLKLEDLPAGPKQMNAVCAIIGYRLLGMSDSDIAHALGCTDAQLFSIVNSEAFTKSWQDCIDAFVAGQSATARDLIASSAVQAAQTLVTVMKTSRNEGNKMRAAESVLNRMGISDANAAHDAMGQGLIIKVVRDAPGDVTIKVGV